MVRRSLYGAGGRPNVRSVIDDCGVLVMVSFRHNFVKNHKGPGNKQHLLRLSHYCLIYFACTVYRRRSAKPPLLPRFQATPLARSAHLFGYIYAPCSLCIALRHIHQTMATSDKYDRQLRLWGASGQRALGETCIVLINATASGTETLKNLGKCIVCFVGTCTRSAFVVLFRHTHPLLDC